MLVEIKTTVC